MTRLSSRLIAALICDEIPQDIVLLEVGPRPLDVAKVLRELAGDEVVSKWVGHCALRAP